jgi:hypothetical protein
VATAAMAETEEIKMIRLATRADLNLVTDLILEFLTDTAYNNHTTNIDEDHIKKLVHAILHQGYIWLYFNEEVAVGILVAVKEQNIWMPNKISLREMVWYVREEYRRTLGAGRLFIEFCQQGDELIKKKMIEGYFTTRMTSTTDYDLESRGFRLTEKLYLKDN